MKLTLDQRGRHDVFDMGTSLEPGWWKSHSSRAARSSSVGRRRDWRIGDAQRESLTEKRNPLAADEEATREAELLRDRLDRVRRLIPDPWSPRGEDHSLI